MVVPGEKKLMLKVMWEALKRLIDRFLRKSLTVGFNLCTGRMVARRVSLAFAKCTKQEFFFVEERFIPC